MSITELDVFLYIFNDHNACNLYFFLPGQIHYGRMYNYSTYKFCAYLSFKYKIIVYFYAS